MLMTSVVFILIAYAAILIGATGFGVSKEVCANLLFVLSVATIITAVLSLIQGRHTKSYS